MRETHLRKRDYIVDNVPLEDARRLVRAEHYAKGTANTAVECHGLLRACQLWLTDLRGAALWMPPTKAAAKFVCDDWQMVLCLSRFVIRDGDPTNAASFLLGASMRRIDRERWPVLLTYADQWQGHKGTIYEATNWTYFGITKPEERFQINGKLTCRKSGPKTRSRAEMLALGAVSAGKTSCKRFVHFRRGFMESHDLSGEIFREYDFENRDKPYKIESPVKLFMRPGGSTHRVLDGKGVVHCVPAPGYCGCVVRWKPKDETNPVQF